MPASLNASPSGPGTEVPNPTRGNSVRPGVEASAALGTGFADTYGLGLEGRIGYTFHTGVYAGVAGQYYVGHTVGSETAYAGFVGGELAYKWFALRQIEIRPFLFAGSAFIKQVASASIVPDPQTSFAAQPGVLVMWHLGDAFIGADAHAMVLPSPNTVALLGSAGFGF